MNYADIKRCDVANGTGVRVSLFVSGCTHHCPECFNSEAWDFDYGKPFTEKEKEEILSYLEPTYVAGLSLLGEVHERYPEKDVWCFTGYLFDRDIRDRMCRESEVTRELLSYIDIMVDGEFIVAQKNLKVNFRGSDNQRIIDVKKSLESGEVVHWEGEIV